MFVKLTADTEEGEQEMWFNPQRITRIIPREEGCTVCVDEGGSEASQYHVLEGPLDIDNRSYKATQGRFGHQQQDERGEAEADAFI